MAKIMKMAPRQELELVEWRERALAAGRSTAPSDRPAAEAVFRQFAQAIGRKPMAVWWFDGPATAFMASVLFGALQRDAKGPKKKSTLRSQLDSQLRSQLDSQLDSQLYSQLRSQLYSQLYSQLRSQLDSQLDSQLYSQLGSQLRSQLDSQLDSQLRSQLDSQLGAASKSFPQFYWPGWWGQHELAWKTYFAFAEHLGVKYSPADSAILSGWKALGESTGWWCCFGDEDVFACERPERQAVDAEGRLHHESGPALLCRDGFGVYSWHGVVVPAAVIERPDSITHEAITSEPNAEVRRVMTTRFGEGRYIEAIGAKREQADDYGELYRVTRRELTDLVMVKVLNSTPEPDGSIKPYWLRVPPTVQSAREAVAWSFGVERAEDYAPAIET